MFSMIFTLVRTNEVNLYLGYDLIRFLKEEEGYYTYYCLGMEDVLSLLALVCFKTPRHKNPTLVG
jgi:hypothetical protein